MDGSRSTKASRIVLSFALGAALLLGAWVLYANPPEHARFYPPCLFHQLTGLHCPGCGSTRCLHALLHLRVGEALQKNMLVVFVLPFIGMSATRWWWRWSRGLPPVIMKPVSPWLMSFIGITVVAFGVLRNLPWPPFTLLAPH